MPPPFSSTTQQGIDRQGSQHRKVLLTQAPSTAPYPPTGPAQIVALRVQNYRALHNLHLSRLTPVTVLLGPNGSGKSTVFDVFSFLSESFQSTLRQAWDRRGRAREIKTRGHKGPVVVELKYRESPAGRLLSYHLEVDEHGGKVFVAREWLQWERVRESGRPFRFLDFQNGTGWAVPGVEPAADGERVEIPLQAPDILAVSALGQFAEHPRVAALRTFIADWYVSHLSIDATRSQPEVGTQEQLSKNGDNLANVLHYLREQHPARLEQIFAVLRSRVPRLEQVITEPLPDGRLLLQVKDAPFERPILARNVSDGTLKMLAYLVLLYSPNPPRFIGIEEPENFLHPRLLAELAEECRRAADHAQLLVTTHSPFFLNSIRPEEVRVLYRDTRGYTQAIRAADDPKVLSFMANGAALGELWIEGQFGVGDPLVNAGAPQKNGK
jgi:predicted ATPase